MNPDRYERMKELLLRIVDLPAAERKLVLDHTCAGDPEFRAEIEVLLQHDVHPVSSRSSSTRDNATVATRPSLSPGERLAGRYRLRCLLGAGGMGDVYEAEDEELAVVVALKVLRLDLGHDEQARQTLRRLKHEVLLARSITHPNVCRVYDLGRHGLDGESLWFLTMELLRGETLRERVRRRGRLRAAEALAWVEQMVSGLSAAHRAGVVHLDFKSGNVMVVGAEGDAGRVVVTDFGVSRRWVAEGGDEEGAGLATGAGLAGTPEYMAPEQLRGECAGPAADIYALGVVLYELVTGELPFGGRRRWEAAVRRMEEAPPSPRSVVADMDARWEAVILRCLAREPAERFARVEEVWEALSGERLLGSPGSPVMRFSWPGERDAFVGRKAELDELGRRVGKSGAARLVTLLGAAGMGKTRLAVRYGWQSLGEWPGGMWFCELSEARSLDGIVSAVGRALGVPLGRGDPVVQLGHAIAGRGRCLVVLDNFEQVVGEAGATVGRWVERATEARFVVTSRERLGVGGEEVQAVEPLSIESGVELFVERAGRQRPGFALEGGEREAVREVVRMAEGMPLAIELGAARMRVMTVGELAARMRAQLEVLGGGRTGRHGSLRAAIEGSWELLAPWERSAWAQCAVFEGGFTLEAAEEVLDLRAWPEAPWVVDVMQTLVDKSLVRMWVPEGTLGERPTARFGMYAVLQEYAWEKLREMGTEVARSAEGRHGRWYARYGTEEMLAALDAHGGVERRHALGQELENLIVACRRAAGRGDGETAVRTYDAAWSVIALRGPLSAGIALGELVSGLPLAGAEQARALSVLGWAEWLSGRMKEALAHYCTALAVARSVGNRRFEAVALGRMGSLHRQQGRMEEARAHLDAVLAIAREVGDRRLEGAVLGELASLHRLQGRMEEARVHYEAALATAREVGDRRVECIVLGNLGGLHREQARPEEARAHFEGALVIAREVGDRRVEGMVLGNLGGLHLDQAREEEARAHFEAALAIHREVGNLYSQAIVLGYLGNLHLDRGELVEAHAHYEAALAIHREVGNRFYEGMELAHLGKLHLQQGRPEEARAAMHEGEALLREVGNPTELAKLLCLLAELGLATGDIPAAEASFREAESLAARAGAGPESELGQAIAEVRDALLPE